jgi:hypothetical protein
MAVKTLGEYVPPKPPKPYVGLSDDPDVNCALDAIFDRITAARDTMRLLQIGKDTPSFCGGICVLSSEDFALFFRLDNGKSLFLWSRPGVSAFGLRNPLPGEYWTYGDHGALWTRHKPDVNSDALWMSYWAIYPKITTTTGGRDKKKSGSADDNGTAAAAAPSSKPPMALTQDELSALGL